MRNFFINWFNLEVSSTFISRFPLNSPSWLSILMLLIIMFSSLDITLVMLLTMPISSLPIIFNVMVYLESALPLHLACKILYPKRLRISKAFGQSFLWIFIPPLTVTKPKTSSPYIGLQHFDN